MKNIFELKEIIFFIFIFIFNEIYFLEITNKSRIC
jgi:hypothetical protein